VDDSTRPEAGARAWVVRGGGEGEREQRALAEGLTFMGWPELGDLRPFGTLEGIRAALTAAYPDDGDGTISNWTGQVRRFRADMAVGDYVVMPLKTGLGHVAIGSVTGDYEYRDTEPEGFRHVRSVHWLRTDLPRESFRPDLRASINANPTVYALIPNNAASRVAHLAAHRTHPGLEAAAEITKPEELPTIARSHIGAQQRMMTTADQRSEAPGFSVTGSQGVLQTGIQVNDFREKPKIDPSVLSHLRPRAAVDRLQPLSHEELVNVFAGAKPEHVGHIFGEFLQVDKTKIVAALGDIRDTKATELIGAADKHDLLYLLEKLPQAADAIDRKAVRLGWTGRHPLASFGKSQFARRYREGRVFWIENSGAWATTGAIDDYMEDGIVVGFPSGDQEPATESPFGTKGIRQLFETCMLYSSEHGVFDVYDEEEYENQGGSGGWLGFPTEDYDLGAFGVYSNFDYIQPFEGGSICYAKENDRKVAYAVRREMSDVLPNLEWRAISNELSRISSTGVPGALQGFSLAFDDGICATSVYSYDDAIIVVAPDAWDYYNKLGAEKSWLGFPVGGITPSTTRLDGYLFQEFEEGAILWRPETSPVAVRREVMAIASVYGFLDFPLTEEQLVGADGADRIQFFEHGVVTYRDGRYEAWIRPDTKPEPPAEEWQFPDHPITAGYPYYKGRSKDPDTDEPPLRDGELADQMTPEESAWKTFR
jgi:hypothetical protein